MRCERGQTLPFVLSVFALGTLLAIPFMTQASTTLVATRTYGQAMMAQYSADAGVEHALWRLKYEAGFAGSLTAQNPTTYYAITVNDLNVNPRVTWVTIEPPPESPPPPEGTQADKVFITASVTPDTAPVGQPTTFTYTISIENTSTSPLNIEEIRDQLPSGFVYEAGSSSGIATADPQIGMENGRQGLEWAFSAPYPSVDSGAIVTQTFRATATLQDDIYWNEAWVTMRPASVAVVGTGSSVPVGGGVSPYAYDIVSTVDGATVTARARVNDLGISILSWQAH